MQAAPSREQNIFLRIARAYVAWRPYVAFQFSFDGVEQPIIGDSPRVIKASFSDARELFKRIFRTGNMGLGEGYQQGLIAIKDEDYKEMVLILAWANTPRMLRYLSVLDALAVLRARTAGQFFTKGTENEDINSHYSLNEWFHNDEDSNAFYLSWLSDKYHMYTCGKWDPETKTLDEAQINKLRFYARRLGIDKASKGKTLIDLGCGWGGVLFFMAETYGLRCKGLTLSTAQYEYVRKEIERRGLQGLVTVELKNVHDATGKYDYVISIGVLEHIARYEDLYRHVADLLSRGATALLHCIYHTRRVHKSDPWLVKYIFPGSRTQRFATSERKLRKYFRIVDSNTLPYMSYPKTVDCWFANFCKNEGYIRELLARSGKVGDVDFAVRTFKHYLTVGSASLEVRGFVANTLLKEPRG